MFCGNCGAENANGAKFCKQCGKPLGNNKVQEGNPISPQPDINSADMTMPVLNKTQAGVNQLSDKVKKFPKKVLAGIGAAVVAVIVVLCIVLNSKTTINLNKYLTIEADGYDGYGTVSAHIDWDAIEEKYGSKLSYVNQVKKEYSGLLDMMTPIDVMKDCIDIELDINSGAANGDAISYTWDIDEALSTYVKCKLKYKNGTYTVSGLTEIGTFDAFADLEVTFNGVAPNGSVIINYTGSEMSYADFICDKNSGLSNGDVITVSINDSRLEYYAQTMGKVPETLEKEYIVDNLSAYLTEISEISDEGLAAMQQQASDVYNSHIAQNWGEGETLESFTYIGDYLLTAKDKDLWGRRNMLYLVYKAQVRNNYSNDGKTYNKVNDIYWYISFEELMVEPDGSLNMNITSYNTPNARFSIDSGVSSGWWSTKEWYYYGYQSLNELYKDVVASNMDLYNHEDNVNESAAPETVQEEKGVTDTDYILPDSDSRILSKGELEGLSADDCKIARNEIYARHGRKFNDEELQSYFDSCDWYEGFIEPDDFQESELSEIEIANKDLIVEYEKEKGYR